MEAWGISEGDEAILKLGEFVDAMPAAYRDLLIVGLGLQNRDGLKLGERRARFAERSDNPYHSLSAVRSAERTPTERLIDLILDDFNSPPPGDESPESILAKLRERYAEYLTYPPPVAIFYEHCQDVLSDARQVTMESRVGYLQAYRAHQTSNRPIMGTTVELNRHGGLTVAVSSEVLPFMVSIVTTDVGISVTIDTEIPDWMAIQLSSTWSSLNRSSILAVDLEIDVEIPSDAGIVTQFREDSAPRGVLSNDRPNHRSYVLQDVAQAFMVMADAVPESDGNSLS